MGEAKQIWIAVYTRAHAEKRVALQIRERGVSCFVPLQRRLHKWSDRSMWVEEPLIPSYVFVFLSPLERHRLFDIQGFVRLIMFNGRVAVVHPEEIDLLRRAEAHPEAVAEGVQRIARGERVVIAGGLFAGYNGIVVRVGDISRVAVSIEELSYAVVVSVHASDLKPT